MHQEADGRAATWEDLIALYARDQRRRGLSDGGNTTRRRVLRQLARHCANPWSVTADDLDDWLDDPAKSIDTRRCYLSTIAGFYRWAVKHDLTDSNPVDRVDRPRTRRRLPRPIPEDELSDALGDADPMVRAWLLLGALAGLRCMEIANLDRTDVLDRINPPMLSVRGKGDKERLVPLHPQIISALREIGMPPTGPLFPNRHGDRRSADSVSKKINRYLHGLEIGSTAHALRHRFGTDVYQHSHDLRLTQELMGHASPDTTAGYAAWSPTAAVAVVTRLGIRAVTQR